MGEMYIVFETGWGWMGVVYGGRGIRRVFLPIPQRETIIRQVRVLFPDAIGGRNEMSSLVDAFQDYFGTRQDCFSIDLDWAGYTSFSVAVWKATQAISFGTTKTYQWLSEQVGRPHGQRAVGGALGRNPFPLVVPCHRVVRSDGALGGFSGPGGTVLKRRLLEHEGVRFDGKGKVIGER